MWLRMNEAETEWKLLALGDFRDFKVANDM